jgi:hypothetical protein
MATHIKPPDADTAWLHLCSGEAETVGKEKEAHDRKDVAGSKHHVTQGNAAGTSPS